MNLPELRHASYLAILSRHYTYLEKLKVCGLDKWYACRECVHLNSKWNKGLDV